MNESMAGLGRARKGHIAGMRLTCKALGQLLRNVSEETAHDLRDGPEGWSVVEIVCHLRDFDRIFRERAKMMLAGENPRLPAYDHEAMAIERAYQRETLTSAYKQLNESRQTTIAFFASLDADEWLREGQHPERKIFTMTDAVMQVVLHDLDHMEQITRVLAG